jgi:hypothetical protein
MSSNVLAATLLADGPNGEHADRLRLFGQFVGSWDIEMRYFDPDGTPHGIEARWHFGWILNGWGVQDVLEYGRWVDGDPGREPSGQTGTSLRVFDPGLDAWHVLWTRPASRQLTRLLGRRSEDGILLEGKEDDGHPVRWAFSEITPTSFLWHGRVSDDGGATWRLVQDMRGHRHVQMIDT